MSGNSSTKNMDINQWTVKEFRNLIKIQKTSQGLLKILETLLNLALSQKINHGKIKKFLKISLEPQ